MKYRIREIKTTLATHYVAEVKLWGFRVGPGFLPWRWCPIDTNGDPCFEKIKGGTSHDFLAESVESAGYRIERYISDQISLEGDTVRFHKYDKK